MKNSSELIIIKYKFNCIALQLKININHNTREERACQVNELLQL